MKENLPEKTQTKEIQIANDQGPISQALSFIQNGGDIASFNAVFELQKAYEAHEAKKAYKKAMAEFKTKPLNITKDKINTQYKSKYSSIGNTVNAAIQLMGECGLTHSWDVTQPDIKTISVTCTITHSQGHSESTTMFAPPDVSGAKNPIQQIKSTRTYLMLATFENILGLASNEANLDDDGNGFSQVKYIDEKQAGQVYDLINSIEGFNIEAFLSWAKIETVESMPVYDFGKNINALKAKYEASKK